MGLEKTGRIPRLVIDPRNPDVVCACALGHACGPQPERGVFRTTDGGKTWTRTLFVYENTGCSDIAVDPKNSRVLFAGMWQLEIHTHVCDGSFRCFTMYFATVAWDTSIPSLRNAPCSLGAPHRKLAALM